MLRKIGSAVLVLIAVALILPWLLPRPGIDGVIPARPFADSRFAEIEGTSGGTRLHWRERKPAQASGPLVVLLHGFGGSSFTWRHTLKDLYDSGLHVIAPDLPPFGYSERGRPEPDWATLMLGLIDQHAAGPDTPLVLVGHSMGAGVAAAVAARAPDRTRHLVMVGGTPATRSSGGSLGWLMALPSAGRAAEVFAAWRMVDRDTIAEMLASALGRSATETELDGYFHPLTIPGTYPALLRRLAAREPPNDGWQTLPVSMIWGEHDQRVPVERARCLLERHPQLGPIHIIEGAAHNPMDTHPDAFRDVLLESAFLR